MKSLPTSIKLAAIAAFASCAMVTANAQNIVADPGFEASADGSGAHPFSASWTVVDPSGNQPPGSSGSNSNVGGLSTFAHSGNNYANLGATPTTGALSQILTTVIGQRYTLSFFLANNSTVPVSSFTATLGSLVFSTTGSAFGATGAYTLVSLPSFTAISTSTLLSFVYRHDDDFWRLDDVSVAATPEAGATLWLAIPALAGLCLLNVRLNRRAFAQSRA